MGEGGFHGAKEASVARGFKEMTFFDTSFKHLTYVTCSIHSMVQQLRTYSIWFNNLWPRLKVDFFLILSQT